MTPATGSARKVLTSGWVPFALVVIAFVVMVHRAAGVEFKDAVLFVGYLAGWIVLPGTVAWRLIDPRGERRHLAEDLAIGALVGYVLEFPVYMACLALGHPHGYLLWPLVPLVVLATPWGRRARHLGVGRLPAWWSWAVGIASLYLVAWFSHNVWGPNPVTDRSLRTPYVDEPYHLSLATSLRHFFPPKITYVDDTPLNYHYLTHLHVAASSWVTGVEPIVLLRALVIPALFILVMVAAAFLVVRLTGAGWAGLVVLVALAVTPTNFTAWIDGGGEPLLSDRLFVSPSAAFVNAALLLGVMLTIELLTRSDRTWAAFGLVFVADVAMAGAKSTSLPTLMAGLAAATVVTSIAARKINWRAALLTVISGVGFEVARVIFFGSGSHGLALSPLALSTSQARRFPGLADASGHMAFDVRAVVALSMLAYLTLGVGVLALLARRGWRRADHVFLVVTCLAGIGAGETFHQSSYSEYYFIFVVALPIVVGAAMGLQHLMGTLPSREAIELAVIGFVVAAIGVLIFTKVTDRTAKDSVSGSPLSQAIRLYAIPMLTMVAICLVLAGIAWFVHRRVTGRRASLLIAIVVVFAGFGTGPFLRNTVPDMVKDPIPAQLIKPGKPAIAVGGITAARWLRAHSGVDDLVATNAHCQLPGVPHCAQRNFWMAGYTERQFLVEGWSYVSRWSVGLHPPSDENITVGPFWDPKRLADNDAAFLTPTPSTVGVLRDKYHVRWLFVDRRFPADVQGLRRQAIKRYDDGRYLVLELR